ncbi:MAG: TrmH family RNA methyltransferase [Armatimonadota bacterium]
MLRKVTGQKEPVIQLLRELISPAGRLQRSRFIIEDRELVKRGFAFGCRIDSLILTDKFAANEDCRELVESALQIKCPVHTASEGLLSKVLASKPTPDCVAIAERSTVPIDHIMTNQATLIAMVENGDNADNLGMLLRSADAVDVDGVVLTAETTDPFSRRVVRGSRGAVFTRPICIMRDSVRAISEAKNIGMQVIATSAQSDTIYTQLDLTKPSMIVVGSEHFGITDEVRVHADAVARIPMLGRINSLNIAVAASIVLYEAVRQRQNRSA